jgi:hypothetical protein
MPKLAAYLTAVGVLLACAATPAAAADRASAAVACKAAGEDLTYDCTIRLTNRRTGAPIEKAQVTVGADMPSMPLAHNVPPVSASETPTPGEYRARIGLEMLGDWALRLRVAGPVNDQLVEVLNFSEHGSGPPSRRKAGKPGGHKH